MKKQTLSPALDMPLQGRQLLEASAGTGKTFAIKILYARLILEAGCSVSEILTVTFTTAAVSELKERIREELESLLQLLESPETPAGPVEQELIRRFCTDRIESKRRLRNALRDFDRASISTIHGFCARMLGDFAFENGRLFLTEPTSAGNSAQTKIIRDFIRRRFYNRPGIDALLVHHFGVNQISSHLQAILKRPYAELLPLPEKDLREKTEQLLWHLAEMWRSSNGAPGVLLLDSSDIKADQKKGLPKEKIAIDIAAWNVLAEGKLDERLPEAIQHFSAEYLSKLLKKSGVLPDHPFFTECARMDHLLQKVYWLLLREGAEFVRNHLLIHREHTGESSFDDLLTDLNDALQHPAAAEAVRCNFRAALIDEFQDTDPIQYEIFCKLFHDGDFPLFLVGDPKQAIYSFRGADFATYCRAAAETPLQTSLPMNFRSEKAMVQAVNELFARSKVSFGENGIGCPEVLPSGNPEAQNQILTVNGKTDLHPCKVLYPAPELRHQLSDTATADHFRCRLLAARIADLLTDPEIRLGGRQVKPSDIAVLVRTNHFGEALRSILNSSGIPAVPLQNPSVLLSRERQMILDLAQAMLEPENRSLLRRALAWDCFNLTMEEICSEDALHPWQKKFREAAEIWSHAGFIAALESLANAGNFVENLSRTNDGERRWCNLEQLAELIQSRFRRIPADLRTIQRLLDPENNPFSDEEAQSRLVSDLDAVTIVTIHKSKGLQYPITLIPTLESSQPREALPCFYHRKDTGYLDFDPDADARNRFAQEKNQENLRMIYVALTRAVNRCEVIYLPYSNLPEGIFPPDPALCAQNPDSAIVWEPVTTIPPEVRVQIPPSPAPEAPAAAPEVRVSWNSHSFSSLLHSAEHLISRTPQEEDYDDTDPETPESGESLQKTADPILNIPGGVNTGQCVHQIFEEIDFDAAPEIIRRRCLHALNLAGLAGEGTERQDAMCRMVQQVLRAPLLPDLQLCKIPRRDTLREFRFFFPAEKTLNPDHLHKILQKYHTPEHPYFPDQLPQRPIAAGDLLNGAVDLLFRREDKFYLVDWKSNNLDQKWQNFQPAGVAAEMQKNAYCLQYLLYLTALRQHWRQCLPDFDYQRHFGGVFYLFVRGIRDGAGDSGIYRDIIPPEELLAELEEVLGV